jgi:hypothetical protein
MEPSREGYQGPVGAVAPYVEWIGLDIQLNSSATFNFDLCV